MDLLHRQYMAKCHLHFAGCALEIRSSLGFIFPLLLLVLNFYQSVALIVIIIVDCSITGWLIIWVWPTLTLSWRMPLSYRNQFIDLKLVLNELFFCFMLLQWESKSIHITTIESWYLYGHVLDIDLGSMVDPTFE